MLTSCRKVEGQDFVESIHPATSLDHLKKEDVSRSGFVLQTDALPVAQPTVSSVE